MLIRRVFSKGEGIDLLKVTAGAKTIGYLYNFSFQGRVSAYQSGFDYEMSDPHLKPGLTSHHLAIEMYLRDGAPSYDFLAGADRYKLSLSTIATPLHWIEIGRKDLARVSNDLIGRITNRLFQGFDSDIRNG